VVLNQVFKKYLLSNDAYAHRARSLRSFGSYQIVKPGGRETALRHEKNWWEKEGREEQFILGLTTGFRGL